MKTRGLSKFTGVLGLGFASLLLFNYLWGNTSPHYKQDRRGRNRQLAADSNNFIAEPLKGQGGGTAAYPLKFVQSIENDKSARDPFRTEHTNNNVPVGTKYSIAADKEYLNEMKYYHRHYTKWLKKGYVDYIQLITNLTQFQQFMYLATSKQPLSSVSSEINITLTYPPFPIPLPNFVNSTHRDILLKSPNHQQYIDPQSRDILVGHIVLIPGGMAHSQTECGWNAPAVLRSNSTCEPCNTLRHSHVKFACPILYMSGGYFQHFLDGNLPKIVQVLPFLTANRNVFLVHPPIFDGIVNEMLDKLNITSVQQFDTGSYLTSELQINTCVTPPIHPILWHSARKLLGVANKINPTKVMLVTRAESRNGGRAITNQADVVNLLLSRYGDNFLLFTGKLSLDESVKVYADVRVMIGVHGGGLYNLMFMSKHATVVEIAPEVKETWPPIFWGMSAAIGQRYWRLYETPENPQEDVSVNLLSLTKVLDHIDLLL